MTDRTEVATGELRRFAHGVEHRGEAISAASDHAASFLSDRLAFGVLNAPFVGCLMDSADEAVRGLKQLGNAVKVDAGKVRYSADTFDRTEENQVQRFGGEQDG
ncbi:hypothetical protein [Actinophytocola xanthii]|uniref:ESX-1 secretion-associated protein n=1 Tax=Actinophytocola xanthii TaxID=1912961 RepID=A0A1Q8CQX7_9PSEU|nr:hypothetical protein [Actinophytocola xanthii]OLF16742.1 hypothetical protein BU204_14835 [Actinophytocola xanthii]